MAHKVKHNNFPLRKAKRQLEPIHWYDYQIIKWYTGGIVCQDNVAPLKNPARRFEIEIFAEWEVILFESGGYPKDLHKFFFLVKRFIAFDASRICFDGNLMLKSHYHTLAWYM